MEFEWDTNKAANNLRKHGVKFSVAAQALYDPYRIEIYDGREGYGEDRWASICYVSPSLLFVVYTVRNENTIRLISARKANEQERKKYRQANP
ncbi:BrnT family toxin [Salmonella enterica]|nr:BrnT family toxin [Salmonella enterica]